MMRRLVGVLVGIGLAACGGHVDPNPPPESAVSETGAILLAQPASCPGLLDMMKAKARKQVDLQLKQLQEQVNQARFCWGWGEDAYLASPTAGAGSSSGPVKKASQVSETNNQVQGVDEADMVKNDDKFIYAVASGKLTIIDAFPGDQAHALSSTLIQGTPKKLLVLGDQAVVFASQTVTGGAQWPSRECTYGYDCEMTGDGEATSIQVFDISNKSAPRLAREIKTSASLLAARRIGDVVHAVVSNAATVNEPYLAPLQLNACELQGKSPMERIRVFLHAKDEALKKVEALSLADVLPAAEDTLLTAAGPVKRLNLYGDCGHSYVDTTQPSGSTLTVLSFKLASNSPVSTTSIAARGGAVYASADAIYVAGRNHDGSEYGWFSAPSTAKPEQSTVHKFALSNALGAATYVGSGAVPGHVLNQFSLDEHQGYLRVATTVGHLPSPDAHSVITIVAPSNGGLVEVGRVDNIAPSEDIRSVRFLGDRGFIVTFKKTDPLFAIDLKNPAAPRIEGELKIPGFSTYLHPLDADHLISIGFDADDQGSFAWFAGIQLQMFDIHDMKAPTLTHKYVIGTRGTASEAATDHLAFNFFPARGVLALPMNVCEGGSGGSYGSKLSFSGLMLFNVSTLTGFTYRGGVAHQPVQTSPYAGQCRVWWADSTTQVKRSVFMDDDVYSIADDVMKVQDIRNLGTDLASVPLK